MWCAPLLEDSLAVQDSQPVLAVLLQVERGLAAVLVAAVVAAAAVVARGSRARGHGRGVALGDRVDLVS